MNAEQDEEKINSKERTAEPLENKADLGNGQSEQNAENAVSEIEKQTENFLPEAERRIKTEADALGITPEELEESFKEKKTEAKLQEIKEKVEQLGKEAEKKLLFEKERIIVPESIMEATSANVMVVRVRPDFDKLRDSLVENGYGLKEHPGRKGVPFQILSDDIYEVDDRTFAIEMDSPIYEKLMEKGLIETVFVVENASEENLKELERMDEQNEFYSKGINKYGQTVHKRGSYLVYEESVPPRSAE